MDISAVAIAREEELQEFGITRKGDLIALKTYAKRKVQEGDVKSRDEKKRQLLQALRGSKRMKTEPSTPSNSDSTHSREKKGSRKIQVGWLHFDCQLQKFVSVRLSKGGGTRTISVKLSATVPEIIDVVKDIFFPEGKSFHGRRENMIFSLGNFKCEELVAANAFCLAKYISDNALSKVRLYLMSKPLKQEDELTAKSTNSNALFLCDLTDMDNITTTLEVPVHVPALPMQGILEVSEIMMEEIPGIIMEEDTIG